MNDMTLYDYWMICYRQRLSIFVMVGTAVLGALLIGASLPSIYEARAMFYVPSSATTQRSNAGDTDIPLPASNQDDAKANIGILKGRDALRAMHSQFPTKSIDALQRDVDFTAGRDGIMHVYVRDRDSKLAADIANAYLIYFNHFFADQIQQRSLPKIHALNGRIAEVSRQLMDVTRSRQELGTLTGSALGGETLELVKNREELNKELEALRGAVAARSTAEARGERTKVGATPTLNELERQLGEIDLELAKVRVRTLPNHPDQLALLEQRAAAQSALQQARSNLNARDAIRAETIAGMLEKRDRRVRSNSDHQNRLTELDQQYDDLRAAMTFLKNSLEEATLASVRASQVAISTEAAEPPSAPVFPITSLNVAVAGVVSVLAGILYALFLEYIANVKRIHSRQMVAVDWSDVSAWAAQHGYVFRRVHDKQGFVIDGALAGKSWRLEWGPSQRSYIRGHELRMRMELDLPADTRMLLLSLPLMQSLLQRIQGQVAAHMPATIEAATPEEMRWLRAFTRVDLSSLHSVRDYFGAVANSPAAALAWIKGPLAQLLADATIGLLCEAPPFLLMTFRGRVYMRMQLAVADASSVADALRLFETAVIQAAQAASAQRDGHSVWPNTGSTGWQSIGPESPMETQHI